MEINKKMNSAGRRWSEIRDEWWGRGLG
ncbi:hypothetical protein CCACVL1_30425 [Corchorus capsularis]|uniref:Uncharacterized protein n=1 Tax=Corchorus capsularis TaxID=210143 RepID=A0A1R3FX99_COCAP|nr:hypothetical protein CCACVL1_30425 [Corchorus capsularis]